MQVASAVQVQSVCAKPSFREEHCEKKGHSKRVGFSTQRKLGLVRLWICLAGCRIEDSSSGSTTGSAAEG